MIPSQGKFNNLELSRADICNAYVEAVIEEKLYIVAGPEFEDLEEYPNILQRTLWLKIIWKTMG